MSTPELMKLGRKELQQTDESLVRSEKVVEDMKEIAATTAATLVGQTKQMETVIDDLEEIHFSNKKANQVIRDITRGIATDK